MLALESISENIYVLISLKIKKGDGKRLTD